MKVYERENGQNRQTQPDRSWWLDAQTRADFDRAVARETLRMRAMTAPRGERRSDDDVR